MGCAIRQSWCQTRSERKPGQNSKGSIPTHGARSGRKLRRAEWWSGGEARAAEKGFGWWCGFSVADGSARPGLLRYKGRQWDVRLDDAVCGVPRSTEDISHGPALCAPLAAVLEVDKILNSANNGLIGKARPNPELLSPQHSAGQAPPKPSIRRRGRSVPLRSKETRLPDRHLKTLDGRSARNCCAATFWSMKDKVSRERNRSNATHGAAN